MSTAPSQNRVTLRIVPDTPPASPEPESLGPLAAELLAVLTEFQEALGRLAELASRKLAAMRRADAGALHDCTAEEQRVLEALFERERRRDAVLARLAQGLHRDGPPASRLSELAASLPEPFSSRLRAKTAGLRKIASELQHRNRLAALVARDLHRHICAVFEDVARVSRESVMYGPNGKHDLRTRTTWVDAVG